jgi:IS4 transposase
MKCDIPGTYVITGILKNGKQFKPIYTLTPQHYNIWRGTIWKVNDNRTRTRIKTYYN